MYLSLDFELEVCHESTYVYLRPCYYFTFLLVSAIYRWVTSCFGEGGVLAGRGKEKKTIKMGLNYRALFEFATKAAI